MRYGRWLTALAVGAMSGLVLAEGPPVEAADLVTRIDVAGPVGSESFGDTVVALPNGNVVVTDPLFDLGAVTDVGAVYLYDGGTQTVISTLTGSAAGDRVGSYGVFVVGESNFVVLSPDWNARTGAVTWADGVSGLSGVVSPANSLVGASPGDAIGEVPSTAITVLADGDYVVISPLWANGSNPAAGAATFARGATGIVGTVGAANSIVGTHEGDGLRLTATPLTNGNYVVVNPSWDNGAVNDVGAVTWGNGATGSSGPISPSVSLVGATALDGEMLFVTPLVNGHYVVSAPKWDRGSVAEAGAVTWADGASGSAGVISTATSLVGSTEFDSVGHAVVPLTNGNYVVGSPGWSYNVGAATWADGTSPVVDVVSPANSLVGTRTTDGLNRYQVTALTNGNYVVVAPNWTDGALVGVGAVTWGNGATGTSGEISTLNSVVGAQAHDAVGSGGVTALANGHFVVGSGQWDNGAAAGAGAATWFSGDGATTGRVSAANSLVGTQPMGTVGSKGSVALAGGDLVVVSPSWTDDSTAYRGAVTWIDGSGPTTGPVSASNSLIGTQLYDGVGSDGAVPLANGNLVVVSSGWTHGDFAFAGAVTWMTPDALITGPVSAANSLVGSASGYRLGRIPVEALSNGDYVVTDTAWGGFEGAIIWGDGASGTVGDITDALGVFGVGASRMGNPTWDFDAVHTALVVGRPSRGLVTWLIKTPVNTAPTISSIGDTTTGFGVPVGPIAVTVGDSSTDPAALVLSATSSDQAVVADSGLVLGGSGPDRTITVTPEAGGAGSTTITVTVSDGVLTAAETFLVTVAARPVDPVDPALPAALILSGTGQPIQPTDLVTFAGSGVPGADIQIYAELVGDPTALDATPPGTWLCTTRVADDGSWSCAMTVPLTPGTYRLVAFQTLGSRSSSSVPATLSVHSFPAAAILPETGAATGTLLRLGFVALVAGLLATAPSRRRRRSSR